MNLQSFLIYGWRLEIFNFTLTKAFDAHGKYYKFTCPNYQTWIRE